MSACAVRKLESIFKSALHYFSTHLIVVNLIPHFHSLLGFLLRQHHSVANRPLAPTGIEPVSLHYQIQRTFRPMLWCLPEYTHGFCISKNCSFQMICYLSVTYIFALNVLGQPICFDCGRTAKFQPPIKQEIISFLYTLTYRVLPYRLRLWTNIPHTGIEPVIFPTSLADVQGICGNLSYERSTKL